LKRPNPAVSCGLEGPEMDKKELNEKIRSLAEPILVSLGLDLVEVAYAGNFRNGVLRIFIDKPGGVTLEDCERAHRYLGHALDVEDPIPHAYTLEVSSPGLDRPLRGESDFSRHRGERVRVRTASPLEGRREWTGEIVGVGAEKVTLKISDKQALEVPLSEVVQAKLLPSFS
jgi:ribosome maturation factor RimP